MKQLLCTSQTLIFCFLERSSTKKYFLKNLVVSHKFGPTINPIQDGLFRVSSRRKGKMALLSKICHTHPTLMKLDSYILPKQGSQNT